MASMDRSVEAVLADRIATLEHTDIPETAVETVRRAFIDTVGVTLAGTATEASRMTMAPLPDGRLLGIDPAVSPPETALALGTAGHALDYDDLSWAIDGHPSVTLVPAILALAEEADASGSEATTAYAAGFETAATIAVPINPEHYEAGWHATATFGAFGAAAAGACLLGLDAERTRHALCIAASTPAGLKRNFGSMTKPLHAGLAARSGVTAALLAREGFTADSTAIHGDGGFWDLYGGGSNEQRSGEEDWKLEERGIHVKAYPCCYFTHTSIAAASELADEHGLTPEGIEAVSVRASQGAADALAHSNPETSLEAKFSMEYTVASALVRDGVDLGTFEEEALADPAIERVRDRVAFAVDHELPYDSHEAVVRIETQEKTVEQRRENPPGTHGDPLSESRLHTKFLDCATRAVSRERAETIYDRISRLNEVSQLLDVVEESAV